MSSGPQSRRSPAERVSRAAHSLRAGAEHLDRLAAHVGALELWTRQEPGTRRSKLTREEIARVAVAIADAEGFAALSMRRLASELDVGTMSLYHYVRTKDEVLALMSDHVLGEVLVPEPLADDWRDALAAIATASHATLTAHPWIFDTVDDPPLGPNGIRHFDQSMRAASGSGLDYEQRLELLMAVDEYVFGHCLHRRRNAGITEHSAEMTDYLRTLIDSDSLPAVEQMVADLGLVRAVATVDRVVNAPHRFQRGLRALLDGFAAGITRPSRRNRSSG